VTKGPSERLRALSRAQARDMGCGGSKSADDGPSSQQQPAPPAPQEDEDAGYDNRRRSVAHQAPELDGKKSATTFDTAKIGVLTKHGIAPARGASGVTSKAKINQDRGVVCWPFNGSHNQALLCIFDGHGMQGEKVSEWCMNQIPVRLEAVRGMLASNAPQALSQVIIQMDKVLLSHATIGPIARGAGTTSNVLYFKGDKLWAACSGDSRAVMGQVKKGKIEALDLSNDHKPDLPLERKRIEAAGGVVSAAGPRGLPPSRVWVNGRVGLAMSRSLGDGEAKAHGVIPDPEVKEFTISPCPAAGKDGDKFVIVASDGIWEFISSQLACDVVQRHTNATEACAELVRMAEQRWREEEGSYRDDITCVVAYLPFLEEHPDDDDDNVAVESGVVDIELDDGEQSPGVSPNAKRSNAKKESSREGEEDEGEQFVKRRLSVAQQIDFDDEDMNA